MTISTSVRRILIASDSFKGTLDSLSVGTAIAEGWRSIAPNDHLEVLPVGDGGEGTLEALHLALSDSHFETVPSQSPQGEPRLARWLNLGDGTAVVELAETCGLELTDPLQPMTAHTTELGRVINAVLDAGVYRVLVAIGSSASTDGGAGMLRALGAELTTAQGHPIANGGEGLGELHAVDLTGLRVLPEGGVSALVDVTNPLVGPEGAAHVFGPQKGATPEMVQQLDEHLGHFAALSGADPTQSGAGAAGGTGFGLSLWGATFASGAESIATLLNLRQRIAESDLVITGEGAFDAQTGQGKFPAMVRALAETEGVPVMLVAGAILADPLGFESAVSLTDIAGSSAEAMAEPRRWATVAGARLAQSVS